MDTGTAVRSFLKSNPGSTVDQIHEGTKVLRTRLYQHLSYHSDERRVGRELVKKKGEEGTFKYYLYPVSTSVPEPEPTPVPTPVPEPEPTPAPVPGLSLDLVLQELVEVLSDTIVAKVVEEVNRKLPLKLKESLPETVTSVQSLKITVEEKPLLQKVLIVGLLPQQAGVITQEFHQCFDLRFFKEGNHHLLKDMARGVDRIILHTNHLGHSTEASIKSLGKEYEYCSGGLTALKNRLTNLYASA